jgi:hypothetical protein
MSRPSFASRAAKTALAAAMIAGALSAVAPASAAGDNLDTPGVVRNESGAWGWWLSNDLNATVAHYVRFQSCCSTPLIGDWDGDGVDTPGVNVGGNRWIMSNAYDGAVDWDFYYGIPGDVPLVGDWNADGVDTIAIRREHCFYFKNSLEGGSADTVTCFGNPTDKPIVGDWDGNGTDTPGVVRDAGWWLNNDFSGAVHRYFVYGLAGDRPIPGDWNGDGVDTPGVHRGNTFYLSNDFGGTANHAPVYGNPGDVPIVGDYDNEQVGPWQDEAVTTDSPAGDRQLQSTVSPVHRFAPRVVFHPDEAYFPMRAYTYLYWSALRWAYGAQQGRLVQGAGLHNVKMYKLGIHSVPYGPYESRDGAGQTLAFSESRNRLFRSTDCTRPRGGSECPRVDLMTQQEEDDGFALHHQGPDAGTRFATDVVPSYYEYRSGRYVTYWFFYARSVGTFNIQHQGDWERIAIKLDPNNTPTHIAMYRHGCEVVYPWSNASKWNTSTNSVNATGTHPVVFVAKWTHGSYLSQSSPVQCPDAPVNDEVAGGGSTWNTWQMLANAPSQKWFGFGGAWGDVGDQSYTTGPLGPSEHKRPTPLGW